jgi:hypothetical protein
MRRMQMAVRKDLEFELEENTKLRVQVDRLRAENELLKKLLNEMNYNWELVLKTNLAAAPSREE